MNYFTLFLWAMILVAIIVFIALYFINAGYGMFRSVKWGWSINNKWGWIMMEVPVAILLFGFWFFSDRRTLLVPCFFLVFMEIHYIHRAFIFPLKMRGKSRMPIGIMFMGITFNLLNAFMQGYWIFYLSPSELYNHTWLQTPVFIIGTILFFTGLIINIDADRRIRNLRLPGDNNHYLPHGGIFNYVTSANYFGEIIEWTGFAIATWSMSGLVFAIWTFANLVPRANAIYRKYNTEYADEIKRKKLRRVIPFVY
jgi:3-oxo-5-alpha-steroid 4-dehydrogenase 1